MTEIFTLFQTTSHTKENAGRSWTVQERRIGRVIMRKSRVVDQRGSHESASGIRASHSSTHLHLPPHDALPSFVCNVAASRARSILVHGVPSNPRGAVALARSFAVPERAELAKIFLGTSGCVRSRSEMASHATVAGAGVGPVRAGARGRPATRSSAVKVNAARGAVAARPVSLPASAGARLGMWSSAFASASRTPRAPSVRPSGCTPRTARSTPPRCAPPNDSHEEPSRTSSARRASPPVARLARRPPRASRRQTPRNCGSTRFVTPGVFSPRRKKFAPPLPSSPFTR